MIKLKNKFQLKIQIPKTNINLSNNQSSQENNRCTINEITDNIYTGGYLVLQDTSYLISNNFTHVINCASGSSLENKNNINKIPSIKYLSIDLRDDPGADIIKCIFQTINYIESKENNIINKKIFFHCIEGISRAPAMIAGYLMWKKNMKTQEAIDFIKNKRKCVDINLGFIIQLNKWENYLFSNNEKIVIFQLGDNIKFLDEKELDIHLLQKGRFLIKINRKLYHLNNNKNNNLNEENNEFIQNVIKYDKNLISHDINDIIEINSEIIEDKDTFIKNLV